MPGSPSFEWVSQELERISSLERLEARGTLRMVLKCGGLDASSVTAEQMEVLLQELLPGELQDRGVEDGDSVCEHLRRGMSAAGLSDSEPSASSPDSVLERLFGA